LRVSGTEGFPLAVNSIKSIGFIDIKSIGFINLLCSRIAAFKNLTVST